MQILRSLDQFGQPLVIEYNKNNTIFKSIQGGLLTIILYSLCLLYFIYKVEQWVSGELSPSTSQMQAVLDKVDAHIEYDLITFQFSVEGEMLQPFNSTNNILLPLMVTTYHNKTTVLISLLESQELTNSSSKSNALKPKNLSISLQGEYPESYGIMFAVCRDSVICASNETIESFFNQQTLILNVNLTFKQFNPLSNEVSTIVKTLEYAVDQNQNTLLNDLKLKVQRNVIDDGVLFNNKHDQELVYDFYSILQTVNKNYFKKQNFEIIVIFTLGIDQLLFIQYIQYAKISEILAEVGSIMTTLLTLKVIAVFINSRMLKTTLINEVISYYFPVFKNIKIEKNLFGKIRQVSSNRSQINLEQFQFFYEKARDLAEEKLTITNIIYELSRIQFILQAMQRREILNQSHKIGIPLLFPEQQACDTIVPIEEDESMDHINSWKCLIKSDYFLLTKYNEKLSEPDEQFYQMNKQKEKCIIL